MSGAETSGGEWTDRAAGERGMEIIGDVVSEWHKHGEGRKTIVFGATIAHCEELCRQFVESGVMAAVFTSDTSKSEREDLLKEYRKPDSTLRVLISVEALAKGFDVQDVGCVVDCRPLRKSLSTAIQMWGRGLRASPETGKKDCLLLDHSGNILRFAEDFTDIFYNGLAELDCGEKLDKAVRKEPRTARRRVARPAATALRQALHVLRLRDPESYDPRSSKAVWRSINAAGKISIGSLFP
jgi:DNA repair protein RadD